MKGHLPFRWERFRKSEIGVILTSPDLYFWLLMGFDSLRAYCEYVQSNKWSFDLGFVPLAILCCFRFIITYFFLALTLIPCIRELS